MNLVPNLYLEGLLKNLHSEAQVHIVSSVEPLHILILVVVEIRDIGVDEKRVIVEAPLEKYFFLFDHIDGLQLLEVEAVVNFFLFVFLPVCLLLLGGLLLFVSIFLLLNDLFDHLQLRHLILLGGGAENILRMLDRFREALG